MYGFDFELDDFQKEAVQYIEEGKSVVVCAPTGAGKTCIAQSAIHLALQNGKRIFYTTPLKALSNQKYFDFGRKYGTDKVGLLTGDTTINRDAQIVVMTTEVFRNMLYGTTFGSLKDNLENVKYVVLDEVHYMNDEQRGTVWEESIIYCPTNIQIIALSATVANSRQLTNWINTVHSKTELVYTDFRPVPLRFFYYDSSQPHTVLPLITPSGQLNNKIRPESRFKHFNKKNKPKNLVAEITLALNEKNMLPAIYFTFSRKKCDENAQKCASLDLLTKEEQQRVIQIADDYIAENPYLYNNPHYELIKNGVAAHHAGLLPGWKVLVERLFQEGLIKMVFATETLAAGINMPARTTIISSISKRTDNGHRMLTANEFLQMSGRAGRRGMDEVGYVVVVGTPFQTPDEVVELVLSEANPLESKFSPSYSMVLNLLQRFSIEEAKELILKTFGYFSSTNRISPLLIQLEDFQQKIDAVQNFPCDYKHTAQDVYDFCKWKNMFIEARKLTKTLNRQASQRKQPLPEEAREFAQKAKEYRVKMESYGCNTCKRYSKHRKELEVMERYERKARTMQKDIEFQKDVYWQKFLAHREILRQMNYLENDYPTQRGKTAMVLRTENELFMSEVILSGILDTLSPSELASVICALSCEEMRGDRDNVSRSPCANVRKALNKIRDIQRQVHRLERDHNIENQINMNAHFSYLIEYWVNSGLCEENDPSQAWEEMFSDCEFSQGDVVRAFKRTIDVLRQLTIVENTTQDLVETARAAIKAINKEPINVD